MAVTIDGNTRIGSTVTPTTTIRPVVATSPVPASQPKTELYQAVDGSVWRWNAQVNQWQKVQSTPSVATPYAPQLVGTITKPIAGQPGAFVTVKNTANPTAPGEVFLPNATAPIIIPAGPAAGPPVTIPTSGPPPVPVINNANVAPPSSNASYGTSVPAPTSTAIFAQPATPLGTPPIALPAPQEISLTWPLLILLALGAILLFGDREESHGNT